MVFEITVVLDESIRVLLNAFSVCAAGGNARLDYNVFLNSIIFTTAIRSKSVMTTYLTELEYICR